MSTIAALALRVDLAIAANDLALAERLIECIYAQYDRFSAAKGLWALPKIGQLIECDFCDQSESDVASKK